MRRLIYAPVLMLLAAPALWAAPPEAPPKLDAQAGRPVLFDVKLEAGKKLGWAPGFDKSRCPVVRLHSDDPAVLSFMALPDAAGEFRLTWWTVGEAAYSQTVVTVGGQPPPIPPKPEPGPSPDPGPDPAPVKVDSVFVIVVEDAAGPRSVETARALNDPLWAALRPKNDYRHYLSDSATAVSSGYTATAKAVGLPAVLVLDARDGAVLKKFRLTTAAEVSAVVKAVTK